MVMQDIMIVDDDEGTLTLLGVMLERGGFNVVRAHNGYEALDLLKRLTPDLFIVDVMMPGMTGIELCENLRARAETAPTPVIVLTAHGSPELVDAAMNVGANACLNKPILWRDMLRKVVDLLNLNEKALAG